jgi:hypothetical protein
METLNDMANDREMNDMTNNIEEIKKQDNIFYEECLFYQYCCYCCIFMSIEMLSLLFRVLFIRLVVYCYYVKSFS